MRKALGANLNERMGVKDTSEEVPQEKSKSPPAKAGTAPAEKDVGSDSATQSINDGESDRATAGSDAGSGLTAGPESEGESGNDGSERLFQEAREPSAPFPHVFTIGEPGDESIDPDQISKGVAALEYRSAIV